MGRAGGVVGSACTTCPPLPGPRVPRLGNGELHRNGATGSACFVRGWGAGREPQAAQPGKHAAPGAPGRVEAAPLAARRRRHGQRAWCCAVGIAPILLVHCHAGAAGGFEWGQFNPSLCKQIAQHGVEFRMDDDAPALQLVEVWHAVARHSSSPSHDTDGNTRYARYHDRARPHFGGGLM